MVDETVRPDAGGHVEAGGLVAQPSRASRHPTRRMLTRSEPASDAAARVGVCRPAASGACAPSPLLPPCQVGRFGLHAQSSHPPPERVSAPAPNAGRRRRGGRRPRPDLERRSGLHPAAVKGDGPGMGGEPLPLRRRTRPA